MQARVLDALVNRIAQSRRPTVTLLGPATAQESVAKTDAATAALPVTPAVPPTLEDVAQQLAATHGVSVDLLKRQVQIFREIIQSIDDVPRSYRNVVDRIEDVQRAALWLLSTARTQADFRRFFGTETFMRPTKSVAWDFYNRVFKRGPAYSD